MDFDTFAVHAVRILKGSKKLLLNVATAGGHYRVEQAKQNHEARRCEYKASQYAYESAKNALQDSVSLLNAEAMHCAQLLSDARDIVERLSWKETTSNLPELANFAMSSMVNVDSVLREIDTAIESGRAAEIGAATGAAAWLLVSHLGTASAGAAIGGLSGAAATNAVLAWFGGGALAAGGGGMALGGLVLGGG